MDYFLPDALPQDLLSWHVQRIADSFSGIGGGVAWSQDVEFPFERDISRADIYQLRDQSGISRCDFCFENLGKMTDAREILELGPDGTDKY